MSNFLLPAGFFSHLFFFLFFFISVSEEAGEKLWSLPPAAFMNTAAISRTVAPPGCIPVSSFRVSETRERRWFTHVCHMPKPQTSPLIWTSAAALLQSVQPLVKWASGGLEGVGRGEGMRVRSEGGSDGSLTLAAVSPSQIFMTLREPRQQRSR